MGQGEGVWDKTTTAVVTKRLDEVFFTDLDWTIVGVLHRLLSLDAANKGVMTKESNGNDDMIVIYNVFFFFI